VVFFEYFGLFHHCLQKTGCVPGTYPARNCTIFGQRALQLISDHSVLLWVGIFFHATTHSIERILPVKIVCVNNCNRSRCLFPGTQHSMAGSPGLCPFNCSEAFGNVGFVALKCKIIFYTTRESWTEYLFRLVTDFFSYNKDHFPETGPYRVEEGIIDD